MTDEDAHEARNELNALRIGVDICIRLLAENNRSDTAEVLSEMLRSLDKLEARLVRREDAGPSG